MIDIFNVKFTTTNSLPIRTYCNFKSGQKVDHTIMVADTAVKYSTSSRMQKNW